MASYDFEGEVITSDECVDLLEEQKASKEAEKKQKAKRDNRKEGAISLDVRIAEMLRSVSQILNEIYIHQHNI